MSLQKPISRAQEKRDKSRLKAREWQRLKRVVLVRDGYRCRACSSRDHIDGHHLKFRSQGGPSTTANVVSLCRICHAERHAYRLVIFGDNADGALTFFRTAGATPERVTP